MIDMTEKNFPPPILICIAAVAVNLIGSCVARSLELPLYLDTGGTIFIAMMSGYVPGVAVGFATNVLNSFADEADMYYSSISIAVALYTTFLARRGWFQSLGKTLAAIIGMAFIAAGSTCFIERFLVCTGVVEFFSGIQLHFPTMFLRELADKGLLVLIMFVAIKFVPPPIKNFFGKLGQRQAPLTKEMRRAVYQRKCPKSSLRIKILLLLMLSALFIAASIALISYRIFEQACVGVQIKIGDGLATIVTNEINPARVDDFINFGRAAPDYNDVEQKLRAVKDSNTDIKFLYVFKVTAAGQSVVFNLDAPANFESSISRADLLAGREVPPIIDGDLLTIYKPVRDSGGQGVCYAAVGLSTGMIDGYGRAFISKVLALFSGCFIFVFVIGLRFVENNIILPVNTMDYCARGFTYDNDAVCADNVEQLKRLDIHTGDEIENLYRALLKTTQDVLDNLEKLRRAKRQVAEMDKLAHKDSLTGIKNKAAYDEAVAILDDKISVNAAQFCIVMIDVNYLKRINDTFGHERGNVYLLNAVKLICAVFGEEHVYRIGGDEFVVILEDDKVSLCKYFVKQFKAEMDRKNSAATAEPWEKVSAAIGASFFEAGVDKTADEVFKRADSQMYENKLAMKANRTD